MGMKTLCTNYLILRVALLIAPFAVVTGTGGLAGIQAATTATVNTAGHIQGVTGSGIIADIAVVTNENSGVISSFFPGIEATTTANVNNAGSISASRSGGGIRSVGNAVVTNSVMISARGGLGIEIAATDATVGNFGSISAGFEAIGAVNVVTAQKTADAVENSFWPIVLLSAFVLVTGIAAQQHLVTQPGKRQSFQDRVYDALSLTAIAAICCLGLLVSLYAAIYGWDLNVGLP